MKYVFNAMTLSSSYTYILMFLVVLGISITQLMNNIYRVLPRDFANEENSIKDQ